jgi:hypothetical protein
MRYDGDAKSAESIISTLLDAGPTSLQIQRQLVDSRLGLAQTDAGTELRKQLGEQRVFLIRELTIVELDIKKSQGDPSTMAREEKRRLTKRLAGVERQLASLDRHYR